MSVVDFTINSWTDELASGRFTDGFARIQPSVGEEIVLNAARLLAYLGGALGVPRCPADDAPLLGDGWLGIAELESLGARLSSLSWSDGESPRTGLSIVVLNGAVYRVVERGPAGLRLAPAAVRDVWARISGVLPAGFSAPDAPDEPEAEPT